MKYVWKNKELNKREWLCGVVTNSIEQKVFLKSRLQKNIKDILCIA